MMKSAYQDQGYRQLLTTASTVLERTASVCKALEEEEQRLNDKLQLDSHEMKRLNEARKYLRAIRGEKAGVSPV